MRPNPWLKLAIKKLLFFQLKIFKPTKTWMLSFIPKLCQKSLQTQGGLYRFLASQFDKRLHGSFFGPLDRHLANPVSHGSWLEIKSLGIWQPSVFSLWLPHTIHHYHSNCSSHMFVAGMPMLEIQMTIAPMKVSLETTSCIVINLIKWSLQKPSIAITSTFLQKRSHSATATWFLRKKNMGKIWEKMKWSRPTCRAAPQFFSHQLKPGGPLTWCHFQPTQPATDAPQVPLQDVLCEPREISAQLVATKFRSLLLALSWIFGDNGYPETFQSLAAWVAPTMHCSICSKYPAGRRSYGWKYLCHPHTSKGSGDATEGESQLFVSHASKQTLRRDDPQRSHLHCTVALLAMKLASTLSCELINLTSSSGHLYSDTATPIIKFCLWQKCRPHSHSAPEAALNNCIFMLDWSTKNGPKSKISELATALKIVFGKDWCKLHVWFVQLDT